MNFTTPEGTESALVFVNFAVKQTRVAIDRTTDGHLTLGLRSYRTACRAIRTAYNESGIDELERLHRQYLKALLEFEVSVGLGNTGATKRVAQSTVATLEQALDVIKSAYQSA